MMFSLSLVAFLGSVSAQKWDDGYGYVSGYTKLGTGYCSSGYYAGWDSKDAVSIQACADKCDSEPQCKFFSLLKGRTCSRYDSRGRNCDYRPNGQNDHVTYSKNVVSVFCRNVGLKSVFGKWLAGGHRGYLDTSENKPWTLKYNVEDGTWMIMESMEHGFSGEYLQRTSDGKLYIGDEKHRWTITSNRRGYLLRSEKGGFLEDRGSSAGFHTFHAYEWQTWQIVGAEECLCGGVTFQQPDGDKKYLVDTSETENKRQGIALGDNLDIFDRAVRGERTFQNRNNPENKDLASWTLVNVGGSAHLVGASGLRLTREHTNDEWRYQHGDVTLEHDDNDVYTNWNFYNETSKGFLVQGGVADSVRIIYPNGIHQGGFLPGENLKNRLREGEFKTHRNTGSHERWNIAGPQCLSTFTAPSKCECAGYVNARGEGASCAGKTWQESNNWCYVSWTSDCKIHTSGDKGAVNQGLGYAWCLNDKEGKPTSFNNRVAPELKEQEPVKTPALCPSCA